MVQPPPATNCFTFLRGKQVQTPYGWGLCTQDDKDSGHVHVSLGWRTRDQMRAVLVIRRQDLLSQAFCKVGDCVLTIFGTGVVLDVRPHQGVYHVQLWGPLGRGRNSAFLREDSLKFVIPAASGLLVETQFGLGTCRGSSGSCASSADILVELVAGDEFVVLHPSAVSSAVSKIIPLAARCLDFAESTLKTHARTISNIYESMACAGFGRLQERMGCCAEETFKVAFDALDKADAAKPEEMMKLLQLKAGHALADDDLKDLFQTGVATLNEMVCSSSGYTGVWVGHTDLEPRCEIKNSLIIWHWGEESQLAVYNDHRVCTKLADGNFQGVLRSDGCLEWDDGDIWVKTAGNSAACPDSQNLLEDALCRLRSVLAAGSWGTDFDDARKALNRLSETSMEARLISDAVESRVSCLHEVQTDVMKSKTGQVVTQGTSALREQLSQLRDSSIAPPLEMVQRQGKRFVSRLSRDRSVRGLASDLVSGAKQRLGARWSKAAAAGGEFEDTIAGKMSARFVHVLVSLKGLELRETDVKRLFTGNCDRRTLRRGLEAVLANTVQRSSYEGISSAELVELFDRSQCSNQATLAQQICRDFITALADLKLELPDPIQNLLIAQAAGQKTDSGDWRKAALDSLEDDRIADTAKSVVEKGGELLEQCRVGMSSTTLTRVLEHLQTEDVEGKLVRRLRNLHADEILDVAENAVSNMEARDQLVNQLKSACLDFIMEVLPAIHIDQINGNDHGCDWEIKNISFSDFGFQKENVHVKFASLDGTSNEDMLRICAWDIRAHFRNMQLEVRQLGIPYLEAECVADAKTEGMSFELVFKFEKTPSKPKVETLAGKRNNAGKTLLVQPALILSSCNVFMNSLEFTVGETSYAVFVNTLSYFFAEELKQYACRKLAEYLNDNVGALVSTLNSLLQVSTPCLQRFGIQLPEYAAVAETKQCTRSAHCSFVAHEVGFPQEIDWADPGRAFAVRV